MYSEIHLDAPKLGDSEKNHLNRAIDQGYVSTAGPYVVEFEEKFSNYLKAERAVSTQSGTAALHVALYELGIGRGDEVIVPALTFVASVNPIIYLGAKPVFVDIDSVTWNIDPKRIEEAITDKTKAIMAVHLYGNPCSMDEIMRLARKYSLKVIEDAAESLGSIYKGKHTGTYADLGCFSFNGNKIITTGGGGMIIGKDNTSLKHIRLLVNQARQGLDDYQHSEIGFNYRMTNIEAALGLAQIEKIDEFLARKISINNIYREELKDLEFIRFQQEQEGASSSWWMSSVLFEKEIDMGELQKELKNRGIPSRRIFTPIIDFPFYAKHKTGDCKNSSRLYERGLCLPSSVLNSEDDIFRVCKVIKEVAL